MTALSAPRCEVVNRVELSIRDVSTHQAESTRPICSVAVSNWNRMSGPADVEKAPSSDPEHLPFERSNPATRTTCAWFTRSQM